MPKKTQNNSDPVLDPAAAVPEVPTVDPVAEPDVDPVVDPAATLAGQREQFRTAFGDEGDRYLLDGLSFEAAERQHLKAAVTAGDVRIAALTAELAAKSLEIQELSDRLANVKLGEEKPVKASVVDDSPESQRQKQLSKVLPQGIAAFAASTKLPGVGSRN